MKSKKGISLIVLVISIIVMIILASNVVVTLSNSGVINKANEATNAAEQKQAQDLAALVWADAYMSNLRDDQLVYKVLDELGKQNVKEDKWNIIVTNTGVNITSKEYAKGLGTIITAENYGDTVDYTVTVGKTTYSDWQILYHNEEYVYLIASKSIANVKLNKGTPVASLRSDEKALYEKFRVGNWPKYELVDKANGKTSYNSEAVAQLIKDYSTFANKATYGQNVVGSIGGPTLELIAAGWNAKGYEPTMTLDIDTYGYKINGSSYIQVIPDELYITSSYWYWLASQSMIDNTQGLYVGNGFVFDNTYNLASGIRPVVCLKASIPAREGTTTDFSLIK